MAENKRQRSLAKRFHTSKKAGNKLNLSGDRKLVGFDIEEHEMSFGRFIWYCLDNPANNGTVLLGQTLCDYRVKDKSEIREHAVRNALSYISDVDEIERVVDSIFENCGQIP